MSKQEKIEFQDFLLRVSKKKCERITHPDSIDLNRLNDAQKARFKELFEKEGFKAWW